MNSKRLNILLLRLSIVGLMMAAVLNTAAQQEWSYSQYLFNLYDINSAYAGNHHAPSFALRYRAQWMGMQGAPTTQQFSAHTPLMNEKIGAGVRVQNESIGLRNQMTARLSGAYKMKLGKKTLSMGIAAGALRQQTDAAGANARDADDVQLNNLMSSSITPLIDAALFLNTDNYYVGIESNRLNRSATGIGLSRLYYHMNVTAGYMIKMNEKQGVNDLVQLSTLIKFAEGNILQAELNALYLRSNKFWFGGGYRYPASAQVMGCLNITEQWRFGLSYDVPMAAVRLQHSGSAEAFLGFNLKGSSDKSIRYF